MSDKPSRFPLSLSSVVDKKKTANAGRDAAGRPQATTQTAAKNAAHRTCSVGTSGCSRLV